MKTKDYTIFKKLDANREVIENHVKDIMLSFEKHGVIEGRPIIVSTAMEVIDGQHRLEAAKRLDLAVEYVMVEGDAMEKVIALNAKQKDWSVMTYVESYAKRGRDCYRIALKFAEVHKLGDTASLKIVIPAGTNIREGADFEPNANRENIATFVTNARVPFKKSTKFIEAVISLHNKTNRENINRVRDKLLTVPKCTSIQEYLMCFENIINYKKKAENKVMLIKK